MMTLDQAIKNLLDLLNESYKGKFQLTELTHPIWKKMLRDIPVDNILAAGYNLCSTRPDWPPDLPTVRSAAIQMGNGILTPDSGQDGWGRVLMALQNQDVEFTDIDKLALAQTRSIYDLKKSDNIVADRANFIKAWNHLSEKARINQVTLPEVKILATRNLPAFAAIVQAKQLEQKTDGSEIPTKDEVEGYLGQLGSFSDAVRKWGG